MKSEKSIVKTNSNKIRPKSINIKASEDFIENSLIDLPFIYLYKNKDKNTPIISVTYEWVSSDSKKKSIEVRSSKLGVPTSYDYDVLLALLRIYLRQNGDKIFCLENMNDLTEFNNTVYFSYREIITEMGYKDYSILLKRKIDSCIERLCDTNIYNTGCGIYNPMTKEYITDYKFQVGILSSYSAYTYIITVDENGEEKKVLDKKSLKEKASVKIDVFFLKNLLCGKGKISDRNLRLSLKSDVGRRLFLILNKWRNSRNRFFLKLDTLYNRIPLNYILTDNEGNRTEDDKTDYYKKRRLKDACNELKEKGFIYNYEFIRDGVEFIFSDTCEVAITESNDELLNMYNSYDDMINTLREYGLTDKVLDKHFKLYQVPYIQALLRFVYDRKNKIDNVQSYIFKGLISPYENIDERYYNK